MAKRISQKILVAGDICLDVVGVPEPPRPIDVNSENWWMAGETRTHFLPGGALLLANLIKAALPGTNVRETRVCRPAAINLTDSNGKITPVDNRPLTPDQLRDIAKRLTRDEIVHSLLSLDYFPAQAGSTERDTVRVRTKFGFSGPNDGRSLKLMPPDEAGRAAGVIVLDDTGNRFRRDPKQWPTAITSSGRAPKAVIVHKLHRPLPVRPPDGTAKPDLRLWDAVKGRDPGRQLVIVSVDDLRDEDALISQGLSWERTALDLVWQLLNRPTLAELRSCPHLIIRLGLDGAVYWTHSANGKQSQDHAWLIYDPNGIEGTGASAFEGDMVGFGSSFTAGVVKHLASHVGQDPPPSERLDFEVLKEGIKCGLTAARNLLQLGYGGRPAQTPDYKPEYPKEQLFTDQNSDPNPDFACQPIPIIPQAAVPDRGYWRLLDTVFHETTKKSGTKTDMLHRAVALTATGGKPLSPEDQPAAELLRQVPIAVFAGALRTYDRREIENYRSLYSLMLDYVRCQTPVRPLSVAVFGPPGAGKSFGVKMVAKELSHLGGARQIETLTFNLSQYQTPDQLAAGFHLVRDLVLRGKIPLVFFDEFDTSLNGARLGWLRYFLAPMQDAEFLDRGAPHPIGQAIFVFAGGTCSTYAEFAEPFFNESSKAGEEFQAAKGPDFLSRLRGTLDIPGLDLNVAFDAWGPVEAFPHEAAILLRRAGILNHQLREKAPKLLDSGKTLRISPVVLRALLHIPQFEHGNRSFEALLDMSHLAGAHKLTPALLPAPSHATLHTDPLAFSQLLATDFPFSAPDREQIAKAIHASYREQRLNEMEPDRAGPNISLDPRVDTDAALNDWPDLPEDLKQSNLEQADHIVVKLRAVGLWFRKIPPRSSRPARCAELLAPWIETLAKLEHDRWVAEKRRQGWIPAADTNRDSRDKHLLLHNLLFPWDKLPEVERELDRAPVREIPYYLRVAGYEVIKP